MILLHVAMPLESFRECQSYPQCYWDSPWTISCFSRTKPPWRAAWKLLQNMILCQKMRKSKHTFHVPISINTAYNQKLPPLGISFANVCIGYEIHYVTWRILLCNFLGNATTSKLNPWHNCHSIPACSLGSVVSHKFCHYILSFH